MPVFAVLTAAALAAPPPRADQPAASSVPEGCHATVERLPASAVHQATDPRLKGDTVMVVLKADRRLQLFEGGKLARLADGSAACWPVGLASGYPAGHKQRMGDMKTPEGWYKTSDRPWSAFYHAITIHYPEVRDADAGVKDGRITKTQRDAIATAQARGTLPPMETRLGGKILVHGGGGSSDWTLGCVAMDDVHIDALRERLPKSMRTNILILP